MAEEQKKKKFNLYRFLNEGNDQKGVEKDANEKRNLTFFFKLYLRRFGTIVKLNLMFLIANFPLFFVLLAVSGYVGKTTTAPSSAFFANLHPLISSGNGNPVLAAMYGVTGIQGTMMINTTATYVLYALGLLLLFTFGLSNVGVTYNLRNIVRGEPLFLLSDFVDSVKKNLRQGLLAGIFDILIIAVLCIDIYLYQGYMKYIALGILCLYSIMRFYIYILIPTFSLSFYKILKNSFIFIALNIKRNLAALAGIIFLLVFNYVVFCVYYPIGLLMPLAMTISTCMFIGTYAAWPSIKEIMIDPYQQEPEKPEAPIFKDRG